MVLLFGTATPLAAIDLTIPKVPDSFKQLQTDAEKKAAGLTGPARISASPRIVDIPEGQTESSTMVSWNGGDKHPNAKLYVSVDGQKAKLVDGKPKGTRQMKVERSKSYLYMLVDTKFQATTKVTVRPGPAVPPVQAPEEKPPKVEPAPRVPMITATPRVVTIPGGQGTGSTTLTWDGGPEHRYAEVWVGVNGEDPTFLVEQGKGSRKVTVEPGKTYLYILTDSGQQLSTVTVKAK
jgi:hypothetical protein